MVGIAQLVEHRVVVADVAGSSPVTHPMKKPRVDPLGFFMGFCVVGLGRSQPGGLATAPVPSADEGLTAAIAVR